MQINTIHNMDYLLFLQSLPDQSVDLVIIDPPYNNTDLPFDKSIVDYSLFFNEVWRILKDKHRACVVFAAGHLATKLRYEWHGKGYRYSWTWEKTMPTNFPNAKVRPLHCLENILVFGLLPTTTGAHKNTLRYFPQMTPGKAHKKKQIESTISTHNLVKRIHSKDTNYGLERYPTELLRFSNGNYQSLHPTQKPSELLEYLIKTYTMPGETVIDCFAGSGSTAIACINTNRHYICNDYDAEYVAVIEQRIAKHTGKDIVVSTETNTYKQYGLFS